VQPPLGDAQTTVGQIQLRMTIGGSRQQLPGEFIEPCRRRGSPAKLAHAIAQQVLQARQGQLAQDAEYGRFARLGAGCTPVVGREFGEQFVSFGKMLCREGERSPGRRKTPAEHGQDLVPQEISRILRIGIAFIVDPAQIVIMRIGFQFGATARQQGAQQTLVAKRPFCRHPGRSGHPGSAQQIEQQGFGLIALVLRQQQDFSSTGGEGGVTGGTGSGLKTESALPIDRYTGNRQWHRQAFAVSGTEIRPGIGIGRQAVMDVNGRQAFAQAKLFQDMQQDDGVTTTGKADAETFGRRQTSGEKIADPSAQHIN